MGLSANFKGYQFIMEELLNFQVLFNLGYRVSLINLA